MSGLNAALPAQAVSARAISAGSPCRVRFPVPAGVVEGVRSAQLRVEHGSVRQGAGQSRGLEGVERAVRERGVEPREAFPKPAPGYPQRPQHRRQRQRVLDVAVVATPREGGPQIVDRAFCLGEAPPGGIQGSRERCGLAV